MKDLSSTDQEAELWALLGQARRAMLKVRRQELRQYNISVSKSTLLFVIQLIGDKATPAQISRRIFLESHSVSELLSRMEKEGLLRKVKDLDKKNQVRVVLTEKGREIYHQTRKLESIRNIMSSLSGEERQRLRSCLETLRDNALKELGVEYKPIAPA